MNRLTSWINKKLYLANDFKLFIGWVFIMGTIGSLIYRVAL